MVDVHSKALNKTIKVGRLIAKVEGKHKGPTVVFFAGLHGNEPAGVFALEQVFKTINKDEAKGTIYAITGNLKALETGRRFMHKDLNRLWTSEALTLLDENTVLQTEDAEQYEIYELIKEIFSNSPSPYFFIDIHTTSSSTLPFITINDALINRKFSQNFPLPTVLGIEEYLEGPLLSYLNKLGHVSLGFEAGQHDDKQSIQNAEAFINLTLEAAGSISGSMQQNNDGYYKTLEKNAKYINEVYEVIYLHRINKASAFQMKPGFESFQPVKKGTLLATDKSGTIKSPKHSNLFMPLYQATGSEGFFLIKKIRPFFLKLSALLRKIRVDNLLIVLPGISWQDKQKGVLKVNLSTTRFMAKPIFHLLGYRNKILDKTHLLLFNRERVAKTKAYQNFDWYKKN